MQFSGTLESLLSALGTSAAGHAVFSRHGVPLLLLPKDKAIALATIGLYRPQSAKAKTAATAMRTLCRMGLHGTLLPKVPGKSDGTGVLICNPCHGTRVIAVRRGVDGRLEILKAALRENAEAIRREHAVLERLNGLNHERHETHETISTSNHSRMDANMEAMGRPGVPMVGPLVESGGAVWFSMPFLCDAPSGVDPVPLLKAWETEEIEPAEDNGLIRDLLPLLDEQTRTALAGRTVRRALVHGDFAPWNWRLAPDENHGIHGWGTNHETHKAHETEGSRLVCIDWEWAREDGFAGFDFVYSLVQTALLVSRVPKHHIRSFIRRHIAKQRLASESLISNSGLSTDILVTLVLAYRRMRGMESEPPKTRSIREPCSAHDRNHKPHKAHETGECSHE